MLTLCLPFDARSPLLHNTQHFLLYSGSRLKHSRTVYGRNHSCQPWEGRSQYTLFSGIMSTLAECNTVRQYDRPAVQSSEAVMVIWKFDHHMPNTLCLGEFWRVSHISWTICLIWITQKTRPAPANIHNVAWETEVTWEDDSQKPRTT